MIKIEINGIPIEARDGATVIEAADEAGIAIPRFCYHKKLSIAANCRMCLVEVEKVAKPLPACASPVTEGMKVHTRSPKALAAQRAVMEFLLINHPLDCPICDQGGECDLQEMSVGYGRDLSHYSEGKRVVSDRNLGPLIATDMTRCIHCTRCVRFGQEVAGVMEMGGAFRGEHTRIGTYVERSIDSELSGNMIDLCPVGALTSKPFRYSARSWELKKHPGISPHDCVGANLNIETRNGKVMRVRPRENEAVNEIWLADRDRFSYTAIDHAERLTKPKIKMGGVWHETDWDSALTFAADRLKGIVQQDGAARLGALASAGSTTEELYLLQRLMRGLGSGNIDHRLRQQAFGDQASLPPFPSLGCSIQELERLDAVLLVGSNIRKEQPLLGHRLRKAALAGGRVMAINPIDYDFNFPLAEKVIDAKGAARALAAVAKALLDITGKPAPAGFDALTTGVQLTETHRRMARHLLDARRASVLVGNGVARHLAADDLRALAALIALLSGARFGEIADGGNSVGAALAGALPHRGAGGKAAEVAGLDWHAMLKQPLKGWLLLGVEPEFDMLEPARAVEALKAGFVVSLTSFAGERMYEYADVLLPIGTFAESSGTFVNGEGRWQSFTAAARAPGEARPGWKVLRVLGNMLDVKNFEYLSSEEVRDELRLACPDGSAQATAEWRCPATLASSGAALTAVCEQSIYDIDGLTRRAEPLQATADGRRSAVRLHPESASQLGLQDGASVVVNLGGNEAQRTLVVDQRVPQGAVLIVTGSGLDATCGDHSVTLRRI